MNAPLSGTEPITVTVVQVGNDLVVVLPESLREHLGVRAGDKLSLEKTEAGITVLRGNPKIARQVEAARRIMGRYRNTLRELAR